MIGYVFQSSIYRMCVSIYCLLQRVSKLFPKTVSLTLQPHETQEGKAPATSARQSRKVPVWSVSIPSFSKAVGECRGRTCLPALIGHQETARVMYVTSFRR